MTLPFYLSKLSIKVPTPTHIVWQRITYAKQYAGWEDAVVKII
jgi:hypothetical protein